MIDERRYDLIEFPADCAQEGDAMKFHYPTDGRQHVPSITTNTTADPHLATDCPECGNGRLCSPQLCKRRAELQRQAYRATLRRQLVASEVVNLAEERAKRQKPLIRGAHLL